MAIDAGGLAAGLGGDLRVRLLAVRAVTAPIHITDHALVRWLERTGAVEIEPLRIALAQSLQRATAAAEAIGAGKFLILADGMVYVIRDHALVTVIPEDKRHLRAKLLSRRGEDPEADTSA